MISRVRHIGIVVSDLNRSLEFYRDLLGLTVWCHAKEESEYVAKVVGMPNVKLEWIKLKSKDGFVVELLQYYSHPDKKNEGAIPSNRIGCSHVAFTVSDLDSFYETLRSKQFHCNNAPQISPDGKCKVLYCHDLDGTIIEVVEELV